MRPEPSHDWSYQVRWVLSADVPSARDHIPRLTDEEIEICLAELRTWKTGAKSRIRMLESEARRRQRRTMSQ